jgi:hypothetical protein
VPGFKIRENFDSRKIRFLQEIGFLQNLRFSLNSTANHIYSLKKSMTIISDLDLSKITQAISLLKQQLPPESELGQRLSQQTRLWTATVQEAQTWLAIQQCFQIIEKEEQKIIQRSETPNPVLGKIKQILWQAVNPEEKNKLSFKPDFITETQSPSLIDSRELVQPPEKAKNNVQPPEKAKNPVQSPKKAKNINISTSQLDEKTVRQTCWDLAHCTRKTKINDSLEELEELRQQTAPTPQPQAGDVVLHGTVLTTSTSIWIAPLQTISTFSQLAENLPFINPNGQIWLYFSDIYTEKAQHLDLPIPRWCQDYPDTYLLWQRWIDLLYWTVMAPDSAVFMTGQKTLQLSTERENILTALLTIHKDFSKGFNEPAKYTDYLGYNLHKLYAVFHQFLDAEDMAFDTVPKQVFANLRRCVDSNISTWQKQLNISEEHPAGPLNVRNRGAKEYLASITNRTDSMNNIQLPSHHAFSDKINAEKSQVLYWTRPSWKQPKLSPTHHCFDLKGSVLYCYA